MSAADRWILILLALAVVPASRRQVAASPPPAGFKLVSFTPGELAGLRELRVDQSVPRYDLPANRLIFSQLDVRLLVVGHHDYDPETLRIGGLRNPDIQIPLGARLTFTIIDEGQLGMSGANSFAIVPRLTPFATGEFHWNRDRSYRTPMLPPRDKPGKLYDVVAVYRATRPGIAYYERGAYGFAGQYGRLIVVP